MVVVAFNADRQLSIQRRLVEGSRSMAAIVADSRTVAEATNQELARIAELDSATARLEGKLAQIGATNARIKADLVSMAATADLVYSRIATLDEQAAASHALLRQIAGESQRLQATLVGAHYLGVEVSHQIRTLVQIQEGVGADLAAINHKTRLLGAGGD